MVPTLIHSAGSFSTAGRGEQNAEPARSVTAPITRPALASSVTAQEVNSSSAVSRPGSSVSSRSQTAPSVLQEAPVAARRVPWNQERPRGQGVSASARDSRAPRIGEGRVDTGAGLRSATC